MDELLRLAEDAAMFMDVENVRVCFPLCVEQGECLILLDGINEVPLPETWHAMQEFDLVDTVSPPKSNELNSSISQCGDLVFLDDAVHTTPSLTDNDTTSDVQAACNSTPPTPAHTYVCSKRLFTSAEGELGLDLSSSGSTIAHVVARSPSPLEDIGTGEANSVFVNGKDGAEQAEVTTSSIDLLPSVDIITTRPTLPSFESFQEGNTDRFTWLSNNKSVVASDNQKAVYYYVTQCHQTRYNFALRAAMLLSVQLNLPLVALVMVESDVVADARSSILPTQCHPHCDHHSAVHVQGVSLGDKRKFDETMSCTTDATLEQGCGVEAKATPWNHRDVALRGLRRKSCVRMARIARLKKELAELNIPLLVIEYDPSRPRLKTLHTNSASAIKDQQVSNNRASVTPQLRTSLSNPAQVELESSHPIVQILISLCARNSIDSENNNHRVPAIATVTPGPQTNKPDEYMHIGSTLYNTRFNQEYSLSCVQGVQDGTSTIASAAVLVTDGLLHPLQRYVHRAVAVALPALPLVSVDSSRVSKIARTIQNKDGNVSTVLSFGQFCTACELQKDSDSSVAAPSLQELSKHLPPQRAAEFSRSIERSLCVSPYGTLLNDIPVMDATNAASAEVTTAELNLHEEYGRYLCSVLAEDVELINTNNNNNDGSSGEPSANNWSVPWLDLLPPRAARTVQDIDIRLRELRVKTDNMSIHYRQEVLLSLCAGTTKCEAYNTIMHNLYEKGSIIACERLKYWIVYCMYMLYSATQAIQFTYTMLATQSVEDFMCSVSQVSLYVHALREVLNDIGDNLPVSGNVERVETYLGNVLSKFAL